MMDYHNFIENGYSYEKTINYDNQFMFKSQGHAELAGTGPPD